MKEIDIRKVRPADAHLITPLLRQLGYSYPTDRLHSNIGEISRSENDILLLAESSGAALGLAHLHIACHVHQPEPVGRVVALVVRSDARRQGVGRALMAFLEDLAAQAGCSVMELTSSEHRGEAHIFFESLGYTKRSGGFMKVLKCAPDIDADVCPDQGPA